EFTPIRNTCSIAQRARHLREPTLNDLSQGWRYHALQLLAQPDKVSQDGEPLLDDDRAESGRKEQLDDRRLAPDRLRGRYVTKTAQRASEERALIGQQLGRSCLQEAIGLRVEYKRLEQEVPRRTSAALSGVRHVQCRIPCSSFADTFS